LVLNRLNFIVNKGDKIALVGTNELAKTTLMQILMGELEADEGEYSWGVTTSQAYFPKDNAPYFEGNDLTLVDWLRQFSTDPDETFVRG
ncbi:ATP-binding cassette domain-containing protein, partial [Acinetobacter baumannii]|uniref:ATP-binding cassette domain-containing protein n=1 Tax=Acinetobacter baumannii TaxID=470 RepID=UPI000B18BB8C